MKQCSICGSTTTYISHERLKPREKWRRHGKDIHCEKCHNKHCSNPKYKPSYNSRMMWFKDKLILLKERRLTGKCDWCGKKKGDLFINRDRKLAIIKRTHTHHIEYHQDDPLKDTIELCASCHRKETIRLSKL